MTIRAVFFDAGHTILYPDPPVEDVYAREAVRLGASVTGARIAPLFTEEFKSYMATYVQHAASDEQDRAMWRGITRRVYDRVPEFVAFDFELWFTSLYDAFGHAGVWRLYDDVEPALALLRARGLKLGIISNWDKRLRTIVREMGLEPRFDCVTISAEEGVRKPNPVIFERALAALGVRAEEALHVGDLVEDDIAGARAAGMRGMLVDRGRFVVPDGVPVVRDLREILTSL